MNITELAKQAGLGTTLTHQGGEPRVWIEGADWHDELERFAALHREAVIAELMEGVEWPKPERFDYEHDVECYHATTVEKMVAAAVARERERCAQVCENLVIETVGNSDTPQKAVALAVIYGAKK